MNIEDATTKEEWKPKVSVIIPVYNTEKYVREAVDSIRKQTIKELEIIIVNDGSTDNSQQIIDELAAEDSRIRTYTLPKKGVSMARNTGIANARGKYIYFMDSDDLLEEDALKLCYAKCEQEQLDFTFFDAESFYDGKVEHTPTLCYKHTDNLGDHIHTGIEAIEAQLTNRTFTASPCLSFIRHDFLKERHLRFHPGIVHEDQLFTTLLYLQAQRIAAIHRSFFHRRIRENSIMTRKFSLQNLEGYLTVTTEILRFKTNAPQATQNIIDHYLSQMLNAVMWQAHVLPFGERVRLSLLCRTKYRQYVSLKTVAILLFKSFKSKL